MDIIVTTKLNRVQEQAIQELTLKKRQSKKSTMTEKHMAARQQLANELMVQRKGYDGTLSAAQVFNYIVSLNHIRLEHLNEELERRLRQYEYLVEQEKALLSIHNVSLFTRKGVNNFHIYEVT